MNILHLSTHTSGGAGIACVRLNRALKLIGIKSKVLVRNKAQNQEVTEIWENLSDLQKVKKLGEQKLYEAKFSKLNKLVKQIDELFTPFTSIWDTTTTNEYQEADLIHLHWVAGFVDVPSFFEKCDKPIVWTLHDYAPFNNGLHYPTPKEDLYKPFAEINEGLMDKALKMKQLTIVTPSNYMLNKSISSEAFGHYQHHHILNPIDESTFGYLDKSQAKKALNIEPTSNVLVFIADELSYTRKGFAILLEALKNISDPTITCLVVGDNNGPELDSLSNVRYMNHINNDEMLRKVYGAGDVLIVPSLDDNLPNIIAEAHCCGTPVVAFNVGGIPEMIEENVNGKMSDERTSSSLWKTISDALQVDWNHEQIAKEALKKYDARKIAQQYQEIYTKLL